MEGHLSSTPYQTHESDEKSSQGKHRCRLCRHNLQDPLSTFYDPARIETLQSSFERHVLSSSLPASNCIAKASLGSAGATVAPLASSAIHGTQISFLQYAPFRHSPVSTNKHPYIAYYVLHTALKKAHKDIPCFPKWGGCPRRNANEIDQALEIDSVSIVRHACSRRRPVVSCR
jgi:hypothetical protein